MDYIQERPNESESVDLDKHSAYDVSDNGIKGTFSTACTLFENLKNIPVLKPLLRSSIDNKSDKLLVRCLLGVYKQN